MLQESHVSVSSEECFKKVMLVSHRWQPCLHIGLSQC